LTALPHLIDGAIAPDNGFDGSAGKIARWADGHSPRCNRSAIRGVT
jgi:hypothetical protein